MKIQQELNGAQAQFNENRATWEHWASEHDKLQLEDVE